MKRCPYCAEEIQDAAIKCRHCGEMLGSATQSGPAAPRKPLTRSVSDRMISGVCGGFAVYFNMDATLIRLLVVLIILVTGVIPGLIGYVVAAIVIPEEEVA